MNEKGWELGEKGMGTEREGVGTGRGRDGNWERGGWELRVKGM